MVVNMNLADVIILIVISLGIYHFVTNKRARRVCRSNDEKQSPKAEDAREDNIQENAPVIRVIFQMEDTEEDDLAKEIADMFLDGRTFYYSGKKPEDIEGMPGKTEMERFIKYEDVQWNLIKTIKV